MTIEPGPRNLITDVAGILVGNADDPPIRTGGSVVLADRPAVAGGGLVAVNAYGETVMPGESCFWAWPFERLGEAGGQQPPRRALPAESDLLPMAGPGLGGNTTIAVVATNALVSRAEARRIAI